MKREIGAAAFCEIVDQVFDALLAKVGCTDGTDANMIAHWQDDRRPGFRIQVSSKATGQTVTKFVGRDGAVCP